MQSLGTAVSSLTIPAQEVPCVVQVHRTCNKRKLSGYEARPDPTHQHELKEHELIRRCVGDTFGFLVGPQHREYSREERAGVFRKVSGLITASSVGDDNSRKRAASALGRIANCLSENTAHECTVCFETAATVMLPCCTSTVCNVCLRELRQRSMSCPVCKRSISAVCDTSRGVHGSQANVPSKSVIDTCTGLLREEFGTGCVRAVVFASDTLQGFAILRKTRTAVPGARVACAHGPTRAQSIEAFQDATDERPMVLVWPIMPTTMDDVADPVLAAAGAMIVVGNTLAFAELRRRVIDTGSPRAGTAVRCTSRACPVA